jgi:response regulator NasT
MHIANVVQQFNSELGYMELLLVADSLDRSQPLLRVASDVGYHILRSIGIDDGASKYVDTLRPDAVIIVTKKIDHIVLREMSAINERHPTPMLIFTHDSQPASIDAAVKAGAGSYVVDCHKPERLATLLGIAVTRFEEQQRLKSDLLQTKNALQERKSVEKAKGIIMKSKSLSEDQAYKAMRKLAMNHNKRIGEIAEQIISASEVLV